MIRVVVDLTVEDEDPPAVRRRHRLVSRGREVDDRQPTVTQGDTRLLVEPASDVVGPAMGDRGRHPVQVAAKVAVPRGHQPDHTAHPPGFRSCRPARADQPGAEYTAGALGHNRPMSAPEAPPPERVRVLWLIKGLGPGGAEQLLVSSARVADHDRFDYRAAYVRPDKGQLVPALSAEGVPADLIGEGRLGHLWWPWRLRRIMRDVDIVHAHSPLLAGVARLTARTIPPRHRPVTVSTEHNVWGNFSLPTRLLNASTARLDQQRWAVSGEVRRSMWGGWARAPRSSSTAIVQSDAEPA